MKSGIGGSILRHSSCRAYSGLKSDIARSPKGSNNRSRGLVRLRHRPVGAASTGGEATPRKPSFTDCLIKADRARYYGQNSHQRPT